MLPGWPASEEAQDLANDDDPKPKRPGGRARMSEAERREALAKLVLRRTKLTADEAALLREVFPLILASHFDQTWGQLRRRGLEETEARDLFQDAFLTVYRTILESGFPNDLPGYFYMTTRGKILNHVRDKKLDPVSVGLPSSGSEKPRSSQSRLERSLAYREIARRLSPEHQALLEAIVVHGMTHEEIAAALDIPEGTVKSRLMIAKREMAALAAQIPSSREPGPA
jgi:RNA polymerase sigma-70 factor, ECF subfamily